MFDIFSKLPLIGSKAHEDAEAALGLSADEIREQAKADRIEFHRTKVRNGPANFKFMTNGQARRAQRRELDRQRRKAWRAEKGSYFERQRTAAILRAHLQVVGLIPFIDGHEAPLRDQITSTAWMVTRYGVEVAVDGVGTGHASFKRGDVIDALKNAASFYQSATGLIIRFPVDFEPAIVLDESAA